MLTVLLSTLSLLHPAGEHPPKILAPGEGEPVDVPFHPTDLLISETENASGLSFYEFRVPPRSAGAPPHIHAHEDEFFYVVSGMVSFMNGESVIEGGPGTFAALTRGNAHAFWNAGDEEAVMVVGVSNGNFEDFFDAVAREVAAEQPAGPAAMGALVGRLGAERGIEIRMDLLPEQAAPFYGPPPQ